MPGQAKIAVMRAGPENSGPCISLIRTLPPLRNYFRGMVLNQGTLLLEAKVLDLCLYNLSLILSVVKTVTLLQIEHKNMK